MIFLSCGNKKTNEMNADGPLAGNFMVQSIKDMTIPENMEVSLALDTLESKVSGQSACNRYFGSYQQEGEALSFGKLASTMMACPEDQMKMEQQFLSSMEAVGSFRWNKNKLELLDAEDQSVLITALAKSQSQE